VPRALRLARKNEQQLRGVDRRHPALQKALEVVGKAIVGELQTSCSLLF